MPPSFDTQQRCWLCSPPALSFYLMFIQPLPPGSFSFPSAHPEAQKGPGSVFTFSSAPFHLITPLSSYCCISLPSPPLQPSLQVTSLWSQDMSTYCLNSSEKGKLASPRSWAVRNPNDSVCFLVPRPVRVVGSKAFAQCLLEAPIGIFKDPGSEVPQHPLILPISLDLWISAIIG